MPSTAQHELAIDTPLGADALLLTAVSGEEGMSMPFRFALEMRAKDPALQIDAILGRPARVTIALPSGGERTIHGLVSRCAKGGGGSVLATYRAELVPWLWMLSLSSDCRIFQQLSVPEIVEQVFRDLGHTDYKLKLARGYPKREFCVQYRETHLDFVSRLLEDEGIFYYFEHTKDRHVLVLADNVGMLKPLPARPSLHAARTVTTGWRDDVYTELTVERAVHTKTVTLADYNYLTPSQRLEASLGAREGVGEAFDFPGGYARFDEASRYALVRLEAEDAQRETATGTSAAAALTSGYTLDIGSDVPAGSARSWLVVRVEHRAHAGSDVAGDESAFAYRNTFSLVPASVPWRPPRRTPRPRVHGTQSALVVGVAGEEISTDAQGRVKLHFYWDRQSRRDEKSSCWVRCATTWAGRGWGQFSVPRIGQEVLVDFLEGDPDRPVVVGRVYNPEQPPPCDPGGTGGVVSGLRSKTHKGTGYNAIEMNDTAGKELLSVHAQYDLDTAVGHDERVAVGRNRSESVGADESITIGANRSEDVGKDETVSIAENQSLSVGKAQTVSVGKSQSIDVGENRTLSIGKDDTVSIAKNRVVEIGGDDALQIAKRLTIVAGDQITLRAGDASITLKKDGTITIKGKDVKITGSGKITVKADSDVVIKGSKVSAN